MTTDPFLAAAIAEAEQGLREGGIPIRSGCRLRADPVPLPRWRRREMDRWSSGARSHQVVLEHIGSAGRFMRDVYHRPRDRRCLNGAIAPPPAEEQHGQHRRAEHRDPFAETKLRALAEQE